MACTEIICGTGGNTAPKPGDPDNTSVLSAVGVSGGNNVSWTYPTTNPHAVAYVEVYRSTVNQPNTAVKRATISGDFYFDRISPNEIAMYFYWIKIVSVNGTIGELIGPVSATPTASAQEILDQISGILDDSFLDQSLRSKIDKILDIEGALGNEVLNRITQNEVMGAALAAVQSETGQAVAYIQEEITQRTTAQEALLTSVNALAVGVENNAAAITSESIARVSAQGAMAEQIETIQSLLEVDGAIGGAIVQIQSTANTAATTADSKVKTFFQATPPTASTVGDIWVDTDDNNHLYRWSGIAWVDAHDARISSTASTVTTLSTAVGDHSTTIEAHTESIDGLAAQYTVKIDNNGYISGFGLASTPVNDIPYSEFAVHANAFKIGAPDGSKTPFAVVDTGGGVYKTLLNSDVIIGGNVDIANLSSGSLPNNVKMSLGNGIIDLDGAGEIRVYKGTAPNSDYVRLNSGNIEFLRYIAGTGYVTYNYLSRLETGMANNATQVTIPGYWKSQPRVMVSPAIMSFYKKDYANQDQAINCQAENLVETSLGSGQWRFTPTATLTLAASTGGGALNLTSGQTSVNSHTFATQTTPANCIQITPSLSLTSVRGNGSSQYFRRSVRWRVEYYNGSSWVAGAWNTVPMGDQLNAVNASAVFTFPSAGTWQWRIYAEAFDTDSTVFGSVSYSYSQTTCYPPGSSYTVSVNGTTPNASLSVPFTVTGSGEIYEIVYNYSFTWTMNWSVTTDTIAGRCIDASGTVTKNFSYPSNLTQTYPRSQTVTGTNLSVSDRTFSLSRTGGNNSYTGINLSVTGASAVVKRRTVIPNSTTPANTFVLGSYTYSLTSAQVLATGSLNWIAVGE